MQIDIVLGELARRDAKIVAGDDLRIMLTAYSPATPDPVPLEGDVRLIISRCGCDRINVLGVGTGPVIFDVAARRTRRAWGRWRWRIVRTLGVSRTTLMTGALVILPLDGC